MRTLVATIIPMLLFSCNTIDNNKTSETINENIDKSLPSEVYSTKLTGNQLYQAALLYRNNDFPTAKVFMYEALARGNDNAMVEMAAWYFADKMPLEQGQDHNEIAFKWMNLATERNNAMAYYYWGLIYSGNVIPGVQGLVVSPEVVPRNMDKAVECFRKSVELGYRKGYRYLGNLYAFGESGFKQDLAEAAKYYKQGADVGDFTCTRLYADCLYEGKGVEKNAGEAIKTYQWLVDAKAHSSGDYAWAAYMLGKIYREGKFVAKDEGKALSYFELAASLKAGQGSEEAKAALEKGEK